MYPSHSSKKKSNSSYSIDFVSGWIVRQFSGDFNPLHSHPNCQLASVGYIELPEWDREIKEDEMDDYPRVGHLEITHGVPMQFSNTSMVIKPEVGDYYVFPSYLLHTVYPFKTKGERRSISINMIVQKKSPSGAFNF